VLILGIETSCDETSAAVVERRPDAARPWLIRSNIVASQDEVHREWGGVVPELAARQHVRDICPVVQHALTDAGVGWPDLGAVAVTKGPGLVGSLLVGVAFAKSVAYSLRIPLVPVHHLVGHIESLFLEHGSLELPSVVLVVSGGHTSLFEVPEPGVYRLLGRTRDDAAGEAYDKVAKLLGLGYPGGPVIDRLAAAGDDRAVELSVARMTHVDRNAPWLKGDLDFSFSGLKTAVRRHVGSVGGSVNAADVAASFQRVVVETLVERAFDAAERAGARSIGLAGGVSANSRLRRDAAARGMRLGIPVYVPSLKLSTDNAAMIAAAGLRALEADVTAGWDLNADASLAIESLVARRGDREPL
jgi:N6-L-threonylcarbamoyladenine synthase